MVGTLPPHELLISLQDSDKPANLIQDESGVAICFSSSSLARSLCHAGPSQAVTKRYTYADVLNVTYDTTSSHIELVFLTNEHSHARMPTLRGRVADHSTEQARAWCDTLLSKAYGTVKPHRRLKVILNPKSGQGKGRKTWKAKVLPIFAAAGCTVDVEETTYSGHAKDMARTLDLERYDAVACLSGDGCLHEVWNGFLERPDATDAFKMPLCPIPLGTSNALFANIVGPAKAKSLREAALCILKGKPLSLDLQLVSQPSRFYCSFLNQAYGVLCDCDIGTDKYRFIGNQRVFIGYVACVLTGRAYGCDIWVQVVSDDKAAILANSIKRPDDDDAHDTPLQKADLDAELSPADGWVKLDLDTVSIFYAGNLPLVDPEVCAFPAAKSDGLIDVVIMPSGSRKNLLTAMDGANKGKHVQHPTIQYYKCKSYRLVPKRASGTNLLAVDGESVPFEPLQVAVRQAAAWTLSIHDDWFHVE